MLRESLQIPIIFQPDPCPAMSRRTIVGLNAKPIVSKLVYLAATILGLKNYASHSGEA